MATEQPVDDKPKGRVRQFFYNIGLWFRRNSLYILVAISLFLLIVLSMFDRIFITVGPGERGVLFYEFYGGTRTDKVYSEGLHIIAPWDRMYIYNIREQTITKCIHVLSTNGLSMEIELAARYRPVFDSLGVLHVFLGPDYPNTVIIPEVESATRKIISRFDPHEFYTIRRDSIEQMVLEDTQTEFAEHDIKVHDIMIKDIILPMGLEDAIENKLIEEQRYLTYQYVLDAELEEEKRKLIEARGVRAFENTSGISIIQWRGIEATEALAKSPNSKVVIVGTGDGDLPVILGGD